MRIGELAEQAGTSTRMVRYYEQQGLLQARRAANGYRAYDESDVRLVREIRTLLDLGFGLDETRPFIDCLRDGNEESGVCPASKDAYLRKLVELDALITRLSLIRDHVAVQLQHSISEPEPRCETNA